MGSPLLSIQRLLRRMQIKNRFFEEDFYTGLPALQSLILIEIDSNPLVSALNLCEIFDLEKSIISRALSALEKKQLIIRIQVLKDARKLSFKITESGYDILETNDAESNKFVQIQLSRFTKQEAELFTRYFVKFCDALNFRPSKLRKNDSDLRVAIRRFTIGTGLVKSTYLTSNLTPSQWFTLEEIYWNRQTTASSIADRLRLSPSSLNHILNVLEKRALITKSRSPQSNKEILLVLTKKGAELINKVEKDTNSLFIRAQSKLSTKDLFYFASLLRKYINEIEPGEVWIDNNTAVFAIDDPNMLREARGFLISRYVKEGRAKTVAETVLGSKSKSFMLMIRNDISGVLELDPGSLETLHFAFKPKINKYTIQSFTNISKQKLIN